MPLLLSAQKVSNHFPLFQPKTPPRSGNLKLGGIVALFSVADVILDKFAKGDIIRRWTDAGFPTTIFPASDKMATIDYGMRIHTRQSL